MSGFLKWLFHPECSCDTLRERVSLAERSEALCREAFAREWSDRRAWEQTAESNGKHAERLEAEAAALREDFDRRYHHLSVLYRLANEGWREAVAEAEKSARKIEALEAQLNAGGPVA